MSIDFNHDMFPESPENNKISSRTPQTSHEAICSTPKLQVINTPETYHKASCSTLQSETKNILPSKKFYLDQHLTSIRIPPGW